MGASILSDASRLRGLSGPGGGCICFEAGYLFLVMCRGPPVMQVLESMHPHDTYM